MRGLTAKQAGPLDDNLVLKAAPALAAEMPDLKLGRFTLDKRLPVAAGLGGGSSDAGAALRLLARANRIALGDPRLQKVARRIGADVPVCVDPRPRRMRGIGEILSAPLDDPEAFGGAGQSGRRGADPGRVRDAGAQARRLAAARGAGAKAAAQPRRL